MTEPIRPGFARIIQAWVEGEAWDPLPDLLPTTQTEAELYCLLRRFDSLYRAGRPVVPDHLYDALEAHYRETLCKPSLPSLPPCLPPRGPSAS